MCFYVSCLFVVSLVYISALHREMLLIPQWHVTPSQIAGVQYGGHVTDDFDRRVLTTYISDLFMDEVVDAPFYKYVREPILMQLDREYHSLCC